MEEIMKELVKLNGTLREIADTFKSIDIKLNPNALKIPTMKYTKGEYQNMFNIGDLFFEYFVNRKIK